jgi:hypothetical protein
MDEVMMAVGRGGKKVVVINDRGGRDRAAFGRGQVSIAARQRAVMVAAGVAVYQATMNIRTCGRAFDLSDISLCNWDDGERLITTSKFVTDRDESHDPLRNFEAANPNSFHTGIRQLTSPEFLADLRARQAQRRQAPVPVEDVASDDEEGEELELRDDQMEELIEELNRDRVRAPEQCTRNHVMRSGDCWSQWRSPLLIAVRRHW